MASIWGDQEVGLDDARPAPASKQLSDIVLTRLDLKEGELHVRVRYRDLPDGDEDNGSRFITTVLVRTNDQIRRGFEYDFFRGGRHEARAFLGEGGQHPFRCPFNQEVDFGEDLVEISIPTQCLRNPKWVSVAVGAAVDVNDRRETFAWDDSFENGIDHLSSDFNVPYSPRVGAVA